MRGSLGRQFMAGRQMALNARLENLDLNFKGRVWGKMRKKNTAAFLAFY